MTLGLVARGARSLSEHLNRSYRVFKGIDPDSVAIRLPAGGTFEVRHSVTAAPLVLVNDAGFATSPGVITSAMIKDGTITGADIAPATITSDKLAGGIAVPAESITTNEIQNGTIQTIDLATAAVTQALFLSIPATSTVSTTLVGMSASFQTITTVGGPVLVLCGVAGLNMATGSALVQMGIYCDSANQNLWVYNDTTTARSAPMGTFLKTGLAAGSHSFGIGWQTSAGTVQHLGAFLILIELKR